MSTVPPPSSRHRFAVDMSVDEDELEARLDRMLAVLPTGFAHRKAPFGFSFRRELDAFSAIAIGPMLGTGILLAEYSRKVPFLSVVGLALSALFFALAALLLWRFVRNRMARIEIEAEGSAVVLRSLLGQRALSTRRYEARDIVAVLVVQDDDMAPARVLLGGPRHAVLGEVFRARLLDPERLAPWMGEALALVARRASLALRP